MIAGSGTDAGKTFVACRLVEDLLARGLSVGVRKPVVSGFVDDSGSDPARLMAAAASTEPLDRVSPWRFPDPVAADEAARRAGVVVDLDEVVAACAGSFDVVVVETAGGVMSPLTDHQTCLDLVLALKAPVMLVVDASYLGSISHGLTAFRALAKSGADVVAVVVNRGSSEPFRRFLPKAPVLDVDERVELAARIAGLLPSSVSLQHEAGRVR
ncbi:MAG: dethiobiotin synthase [Deltaproteobacteria bacterium]|nr:dethiobiotin synthase [Deltaproteobacteria bacterium]